MFETVDQRNQQILTRIAESRVRAVESVEDTKQRVTRCVASAPLTVSMLKLTGIAGIGLITAAIFSAKAKKVAKKKAAVPETVSGRTVAMQLLSLLVIPALHACLAEKKQPLRGAENPASDKDFNLGFSSLFYRWLGLIK